MFIVWGQFKFWRLCYDSSTLQVMAIENPGVAGNRIWRWGHPPFCNYTEVKSSFVAPKRVVDLWTRPCFDLGLFVTLTRQGYFVSFKGYICIKRLFMKLDRSGNSLELPRCGATTFVWYHVITYEAHGGSHVEQSARLATTNFCNNPQRCRHIKHTHNGPSLYMKSLASKSSISIQR